MSSTLQAIRENIKKELAGHYPEREIEVLTGILFSHRLGIGRHEIGLRRNEIPDPGDADWFSEAVRRLKQSVPVQYLTGETEFFGLKLKVGPEVLIPRPETEELVQWVLEDLASVRKRERLRILDVGTGSGCIALALAARLPGARVTAMDKHPPALDLAGENARRLGLRVDFLLLDILGEGGPIEDKETEGLPEFDLIVSNPPYIPERERDYLDANVREFEPPAALFVPDEDPLVFHRHIAGFAVRKLKKSGLLYLEIREGSGEETGRVLEDAGLKGITLKKDINGKERMVRAERR